jgi:hypothetical protein
MRRLLLLLGILGVATVGNASAAQAVAPSNDDISAATVVTGVPHTDSVDTTEATYAETDTNVECSATPTDWSVQLSSSTPIIFDAGRATLIASAWVQNTSGSASTELTQPMRLRPVG